MFSFFASTFLLLSELLNVVQPVNLTQRHHIAIAGLMEASGTQTVRWEAVNSTLSGIDREIHNSPAGWRQLQSLLSICCSLSYVKKSGAVRLLWHTVGLLWMFHQQLFRIYHPAGLFITLSEKWWNNSIEQVYNRSRGGMETHMAGTEDKVSLLDITCVIK